MMDPANDLPPLPGGFEMEEQPQQPRTVSPQPMSVPTAGSRPTTSAITGTTTLPQVPPPPAGFQAETPAPITDRGTEMGFADQAPPEASRQLSPEDTAEFFRMFRGDGRPRANADELRRFVGSKGMSLDNADEIVRLRDKAGRINGSINYPLPKVQPTDGVGGAAGRGLGSGATLGFLDEAGAVVDSLGGTSGRHSLWNSNEGFSDLYHENLDQNRGILAADHEQHPFASIGGELLGGLVIPVGIEKAGLSAAYETVALNAGRTALRNGATMADARVVAQRALTRRMIGDGGIYGGVHGVGSADGDVGDRVVGGVTGTVEGLTGGAILGRAGEAVAPLLAARAAAARAGAGPIDYAAVADRLGIQPTPATTGGMFAHGTQMAFANVPGGMSAVAAAVDRENTGLASAAHDAAASVGAISSRQGAGEAIAAGAGDYARTSKNQATQLYDTRNQLFGGTGAPVDLPSTRQAYSDIAAGFPTSPALQQLNEHPAIRKLGASLPDAGPITLGEATDALSHVRGVVRNLSAGNLASGSVLNRVSGIEQSLENDVMAAGGRADVAAGRTPGAPGSAVSAQRHADAFYADRKSALNGTLKTAYLSSDDPVATSGETVYNRMVADTQRVGGNLARLRDSWDRLPDQAKNTFAATAMDDLGRARPSSQTDIGDAWSFETLLTNYDKMNPRARALMFGAKADGQLQDIASYASRLRDIGKSRNFSNTAKNVVSGAILATVGGALWHGDLASAAEGVASVPAAYAGAKLFLSTPAMRRWTGAALKAATMSNPAAARSAGATLVARLGNVAKADPSIATDALGLQRYLEQAFSQSPGKAAAAQDEPDRRQEPPQQQAQPNSADHLRQLGPLTP